MASSAPPPQCTEDPLRADQQNCKLSSIERDEFLSIDLSADLQLYAADELWISPVGEPPPWLSVGLNVTSSKRVEMAIDWSQPVPDGEQMILRIARGQGRCAIVDIPITFRLEGTKNECIRLEPLK